MQASWSIKAFDELSALELHQVLQLRIDVFMIEQSCLYPECDDRDIHAMHLLGKLGDELVAYARLLPSEVSYPEPSIGRVAVKDSYRDAGIGRQLMRRAVNYWDEHCSHMGIRISAQTYLLNFYYSFGFRQVGDPYLEDGIPHIEMFRNRKEE